MTVGIPTEIKEDENRVAITPSGVAAFVSHGHELVIQAGAGAGSAITDEIYRRAGATIAETSRPTTHRDPRYVEEGLVHYGVANMPGAVPHTSTYALTNATTAYALELLTLGVFPLLKSLLPVVVAFLLPTTDTLDHRRVGNGTHRHGLFQEPMEELPAMA